jgi:hypothetical protein
LSTCHHCLQVSCCFPYLSRQKLKQALSITFHENNKHRSPQHRSNAHLCL